MTRSPPGRNSPAPRSPTHVIGAQRAPRPLVSSEQVKAHIRLLRTFYNLRITVEDCKDRRIPEYAVRMDKDARWRWFVHLAVERFERWVKSLQFATLEKFITGHIPPVDVWMVWHAYLLSPCWYAEDCERLAMLQQLRLLNVFVVGSINISKVVQRKPSNARVEAWYKQTGTPYNPFQAMTVADNEFKELECPRCRTEVHAPFINDDGTGFAEGKFSVLCPLPGCRLRITHDNLAVAKFVRDLSEEEDETQIHCVAGSLFVPSGKRDARHAKVISNQLMRSAHFAGLCPSAVSERLVRLDRVREIKENVGFSLVQLKEAILTSLRNCPAASVARILSAYTDGSPFSINLVDAVLRQCQFTEQLDKLGWLRSGVFCAEKREILEQSVTRYHAFLDLMTAYPDSMLVPTLDIDLVWHTHQLMANRYNIDCEMYVGRYVDHELAVPETRLSSAFDATCRAWLSRYQVLYTQCGCPAPDETSVHKFVRLVRHYISRSSHSQVSLHPEHLPATHPSTHNVLLTLQTVWTGTFGKMQHAHGKRRDEQSQASTPTCPNERTFNKPTQLDLSQLHPPGSPVYFEKELSVLPGLTLHDRSDWWHF